MTIQSKYSHRLPDPAAHFWSRVNVRTPDECWEWQGGTNVKGYGTLSWRNVSDKVCTALAHRVAMFLTGSLGAVWVGRRLTPDSHVLLHSCDNPPCCNPSHLTVGTASRNQKDAYARGLKAQPKGQFHANAKLSNAQAAEIRRRYAAGELQVPLAKEFGVSQRVVSLIIRNKTYVED